MDLTTILTFVVGLAALVGGAELLVRGASRLAVAIGVSPLVIGLTIVAYGTSSPELAVSAQATLAGQDGLILGNVVGSNICNILLILGLSSVIAPLPVAQQLVRLDIWVMIGVSLIGFLMAYDGSIGRLDGLILILGALAYTVWSIRESRKEEEKVRQEYEQEFGRAAAGPLVSLALLAVGLGLLALGAKWLVEGAIVFAHAFGVSDVVIGLTIVAVGTSLPEIATSVVASIRGERDIAVGNVVGSNIFNILAVLGFSGLMAPDGVSVGGETLLFDFPVMIAVSVACLPIFFTRFSIDRWEGLLFVGYYAAYIGYIVLDATNSPVLEPFREAMLWFVIPITVLTLVIILLREHSRGNLRPGTS
ncbi:MAG: calcium/sodium antiporter [Bryobacteraceae bacterium]